MSAPTSQKRFLGSRAVGQRYGGKSTRTIKRWRDKGVIPPPDQIINNRPYWDEANLDAHDRQCAAARAAASSKAATA